MKERVPQLDAVRGIAILIVMVHNAAHNLPSLPFQAVLGYGWMGVDLFFVLSGFLITGILVDTQQREGYFKNFYARRCLRIWPLYFSVLVFMFVIVPQVRPSFGSLVIAHSSPWWAYPFFLQNFLVHPPTSAAGPLSVTWSVAIEEQFYAVWAIVVRFCSYSQLQRVALAVICLSPVLRFYLSVRHVDLYSNVFCRLDGLMLGGFLALLIRSKAFLPSRYMKTAWLVLFIAAPSACVTETLHARWITFSLSAVTSAAFVYLALFATQEWFRRMMTSRALIYTGIISYGLYLLHKIPFDVETVIHLQQHPVLGLLVGLAASYVLAAVSWNLLETPFLRLKRFFESRPEGLGGAGGQLAPVAP
jgi:peptidoglycan/LPS O-acetylase OafA/YrhL